MRVKDLGKLSPELRARIKCSQGSSGISQQTTNKRKVLNPRIKKVTPKSSKLEQQFAQQIYLAKLDSGVVREYRFCERKWRLDFAWPSHKIAVETHGGIFTQGRHVRGAGYEIDREKINTAICLGWRILELSPKAIRSGTGLKWLETLLANAPTAACSGAQHVVIA